MSKIAVHIMHENEGTIAHVRMDAIPRVGDKVNIIKGNIVTGMVVREVSWTVVGKTCGVGITVAELPPSD
jgi:hypothetical protein